MLCALETVALLLAGSTNTVPGKDPNVVANQTVLGQVNLLKILKPRDLSSYAPLC